MKKDSSEKEDKYTYRYYINYASSAMLVFFIIYYFIAGKSLEESLGGAVGIALGSLLAITIFRILKSK